MKPLWRVVVVALGVCLLYVFLDDYCWNYARIWANEGDRLQALLERDAARQESLPENAPTPAAKPATLPAPQVTAPTAPPITAPTPAVTPVPN